MLLTQTSEVARSNGPLSLEITTILNFLFIIPLHFNMYIFKFLPYTCAYRFFMDFKIVVRFKKVNFSEYCFQSNDHIFSRKTFITNSCKIGNFELSFFSPSMFPSYTLLYTLLKYLPWNFVLALLIPCVCTCWETQQEAFVCFLVLNLQLRQ